MKQDACQAFSSPELAIEGAVLNGLGDLVGEDTIRARHRVPGTWGQALGMIANVGEHEVGREGIFGGRG